jgi:hypothetical protein
MRNPLYNMRRRKEANKEEPLHTGITKIDKKIPKECRLVILVTTKDKHGHQGTRNSIDCYSRSVEGNQR